MINTIYSMSHHEFKYLHGEVKAALCVLRPIKRPKKQKWAMQLQKTKSHETETATHTPLPATPLVRRKDQGYLTEPICFENLST